MPRRPVVVSRIEEGVVVPSLKLQTSFEDLRGNVDDGRSEVCNKTYALSVNAAATLSHWPEVPPAR